MADEPHPGREERRLDERKLLVAGPRDDRLQQLPLRLRRAMRIDEHRRIREKVEVVVPATHTTSLPTTLVVQVTGSPLVTGVEDTEDLKPKDGRR